MNDLDEFLKLNNELKKLLKTYTDVYQYQEKMMIAEWFGLRPDIYFYFEYSEWADIRDAFHQLVLYEIDNNFSAIRSFHHISIRDGVSLNYNDMRDLYYIWAKETGHKVWTPQQIENKDKWLNG